MVSGASPVLMPREDPAGKIVFAVILAIALIVCFAALVTLLAALLRGPTARGRKAVESRPWITLAYGLVGWLVFGALAAFLYSRATIDRLLETEILPGMMFAAGVALIVPLLVCLVGAPGLYLHIGERVGAMRNDATSDLQRVILGCVVALLAALFPGAGWFFVLPLLLLAEFGAGAQAILRR